MGLMAAYRCRLLHRRNLGRRTGRGIAVRFEGYSLGAKQRARRLGMGLWLMRRELRSTPERRPVIDMEWPRRALTGERRLGGCSRKEVIQPHLPVRLPCYDFTPIADPTFDGSLPYGLGHRLRVLPTFVV